MNRRNFTTAAMAVGAVVLLYAGVAMAREPERAPVLGGVAPKASLAVDDHGGDRRAEPADDNGVDATVGPAATDRGDIDVAEDRAAGPSASPDDRGHPTGTAEPGDDRTGDDRRTPAPSPAVSPSTDDHGTDGATPTAASKTASPASPTASPDDRGIDAASPGPTASPDDQGGVSGGSAPTPAATDDQGHGGTDG